MYFGIEWENEMTMQQPNSDARRSSSEAPDRPEDSRAPSDQTLQSPGLDFEDNDDDFNFDDDEEDSCSWSGDIGAKAVGDRSCSNLALGQQSLSVLVRWPHARGGDSYSHRC